MKTRVAVLRGGLSGEYDVSLRTGREVLKNLPEIYQPQDVLISRDGEWYLQGVHRSPADILSHTDVVFNALHGTYGEDGKVQRLLDVFNVPYTGSGSVPSAIAMNKVLTKQSIASNRVKMPIHDVISGGGEVRQKVFEIFHRLPLPAIVKPVDSGSSLGVTLVNSFDELMRGVYRALSVSSGAIVEEFISGREATCGVIDDFRGKSVYSLLPVEIRPHGSGIFDYNAKYGGASKEICPGSFSREESQAIQEAAATVHSALGLRHYSRSDFIVNPKRGVYFLEVNTLPGLTEQSLFPKSLSAVGSNLREFLDHVLNLAVQR